MGYAGGWESGDFFGGRGGGGMDVLGGRGGGYICRFRRIFYRTHPHIPNGNDLFPDPDKEGEVYSGNLMV